MFAVIKANAYGHGSVKIAKLLSNHNIFISRATEDEVLELVQNKISKPSFI